MATNKKLSLVDVLPTKFLHKKHRRTKAYKLRDFYVLEEHSSIHDQDHYIPWPGRQKNVHYWVELEDGYCVGWNENPNNGWSFPVIKK